MESKKHRDFVTSPMKGKSVYEAPGVGKAIGDRLSRQGFKEAEQLYGKYLQDKNNFTGFVYDKGHCTKPQATQVYNGMKEYSQNYS